MQCTYPGNVHGAPPTSSAGDISALICQAAAAVSDGSGTWVLENCGGCNALRLQANLFASMPCMPSASAHDMCGSHSSAATLPMFGFRHTAVGRSFGNLPVLQPPLSLCRGPSIVLICSAPSSHPVGLSISSWRIWHWGAQAKAGRCFAGVPSKQCYIRAAVSCARGMSPGEPFVLEIWPPGHSSPVHDHGHAFGVTRILHGSLSCEEPSCLPP